MTPRTAIATPIHYQHEGEWSGYSLDRRADGLWLYQVESRIQGQRSGRVVVLEAPADLHIEDEDDLDTLETPCVTKAEMLIHNGREVRCLRRGYLVQ